MREEKDKNAFSCEGVDRGSIVQRYCKLSFIDGCMLAYWSYKTLVCFLFLIETNNKGVRTNNSVYLNYLLALFSPKTKGGFRRV